MDMIENKELYKKEYDNFFKYAFQRYILTLSKPGLYESNHVAEGMEDAATEIGNIAKKIITEIIENGPLNMTQENRFDMMINYVRTRFSFDKDYFKYSDEFHIQNRFFPLSNFPLKDKEYSSRNLWSFFSSRIPSNSQLQIEKDKP